MKKLLDPVANAKTIAFLMILFGVVGLLSYPSVLLHGSVIDAHPIPIIFGFLSYLASIIVGLGLRKTKLWGLYTFLALTGVNVLYMFYYIWQGLLSPSGSIVTTLILVALAVWFYSAKDKFQK